MKRENAMTTTGAETRETPRKKPLSARIRAGATGAGSPYESLQGGRPERVPL